ncbi:MAG TPA: TolC family protein [Gemmatimonadaceae bacterium]|nr:TolC family protein [Gemmatimonadaceae bacterium]
MNASALVHAHTARARRATATLLATALLAAPGVARAQERAAGTADTTSHIALSLGDAARLAARRSAGPEAARYVAAQASARVRQERADLFPSFSALLDEGQRTFNTATFGFDIPPAPGQQPLFDPNGEVLGPVHIVDARARVSQTIFDFSTLERVRSARAGARAGDAAAIAAAEAAASDAALAYVRVQQAAATLQARQADSLLADSLVMIAREQLQAGVGVALDVTRAQSQAASVHAQLIAARSDVARSRLTLLRVLGLPLDADVQLTDSLGAPSGVAVPAEQAALDTALAGRADLRALSAQRDAAASAVTAVRAERLPRLGLTADAGGIGTGYDNLLRTYTWGLEVSVPIFDGLRRSARTEEQQARVNELDVRLHDLERQVAVDVRTALLDLDAAQEQVDAARERLRLAEQELAQANERFRAGVAGNADVITASLALNDSRTLLVDALTSYRQAEIELARAQGTVEELP